MNNPDKVGIITPKKQKDYYNEKESKKWQISKIK